MRRRPRAHEGGPRRLTPPQVVVASFLSAIVVGTFLLLHPASQASGQQLGLIDALFMATSAVCINGLAVIDPGGQLSGFGQTVILILIQVGGLGILTLGVLLALATGRRIGFKERLEYQLRRTRSRLAEWFGCCEA